MHITMVRKFIEWPTELTCQANLLNMPDVQTEDPSYLWPTVTKCQFKIKKTKMIDYKHVIIYLIKV